MDVVSTHVLARDCVDNIIGGCAEELGDNGELVDVVLSREQRLSLQHLGKDTPSTPDIDFHVIFLPGEHNFRRTIIPCRDISGHLRILDSSKAEIANFQVAIFVDQDVAGLEVTMNDAGGMDILQASLVIQTYEYFILYPHVKWRITRTMI